MGWKQATALGLVLVFYITVGGLIFSLLEGENENNVREDIREQVLNITNTSCISLEEMIYFLKKKSIVLEQLVPSDSNNSSQESSQWTYLGSMFFSVVLITTIGYGNQTPKTWGGRTACIVYCLFGVPLFLFIINRLVNGSKCFVQKLHSRLPETLKNRHFAVVTVILTVLGFLLIMIPAAVIADEQKWTVGETVYFLFVTFSTVGFGDFVPRQSGQSILFVMFTTIWLVLGLTYMAIVIGYLQAFIEKMFNKSKKFVCPTMTVKKDDDGNEIKESSLNDEQA